MTDILDFIPSGRDNAVTRAELSARLGVPDRQVRKLIHNARDAGALILNRQDGRGYYMATEHDLDELYCQWKQDTARALSILKRRHPLHLLLKKAGRIT